MYILKVLINIGNMGIILPQIPRPIHSRRYQWGLGGLPPLAEILEEQKFSQRGRKGNFLQFLSKKE